MSDPSQLRRRLVTDASLLTVANVAARVISAVTLIAITRLLGRDAYGQYAATLSLARIASVLFNLGLDGWLLRSGRWDAPTLQRKSGAILTIKLLLGTVWLLALLLLAPLLNAEAFPPLLLLLAALSVWLEEFAATAVSTFQASLRNRLTVIVTIGSQLLLLLALLILLLFQANTAAQFMGGRVGAMGVAGLTAVYTLWRLFNLRFTWSDVRQALTETPVFGTSLGLAMLAQQADVVIVANWLGKTAAGTYAPAITLASTLFLLPTSIYNVLLPLLSRLYENEGKAQTVATVRQFSSYTLLLSLAMTAGLALTAPWLVRLAYGAEYAQSGQLLTIFSLVLFSRNFIAVGGAALAAVGWQRQRVQVQAVTTSLNIVANLLVVTATRWGVWGVAWVYVATEAVTLLGYWGALWHWGRTK